jgi:hypothetical protein
VPRRTSTPPNQCEIQQFNRKTRARRMLSCVAIGPVSVSFCFTHENQKASHGMQRLQEMQRLLATPPKPEAREFKLAVTPRGFGGKASLSPFASERLIAFGPDAHRLSRAGEGIDPGARQARLASTSPPSMPCNMPCLTSKTPLLACCPG